MDIKLLLIQGIVLLYRESTIPNLSENSGDMVRYLIEHSGLSDNTNGINSDKNVLMNLKQTALEMSRNGVQFSYEKDVLLNRLELNCAGDESLYNLVCKYIMPSLNEDESKRVVIGLRNSIENYFREQKVAEVIGKFNYTLKFQRDKISNISDFIASMLNELEPLQSVKSKDDPAILSYVKVGDKNTVSKVNAEIRDKNSDDGILRTGFMDINTMTQGGFRRGESILIYGLQHKFKTGFTLSLFRQLCKYNTPYMKNPAKKPAMVRISFEDDLSNNLQTLYSFSVYNKEQRVVSKEEASNLTDGQLYEMIKEELEGTGYEVLMLRVDPTQWTYRDVINYIIRLESDGYEIHVLMLDYLAKLPTTGCNQTGPMGTDKRDLVRRMRNFCGSKSITFISPHQISTDAKNLLRQGIAEHEFVKVIEGKGYLEGCKQLDQEVDLELYIHLFKHKGKTYFTVQRGKHRLPTIIDEDMKYVIYQFPENGAPIPDDIGGESIGMRKLPSGNGQAKDEFDFV